MNESNDDCDDVDDTYGAVAQFGSAVHCRCEGCGFESRLFRPHGVLV